MKKIKLLLFPFTVYTSSSAVVDRLRAALCLSVVSFNSIIPRGQSFSISYFGFRFINGYN